MRPERPDLPPEVMAALRQADRLEWWTLFWLGLIALMMWAVMGGSQAFRTAFFEDILSLLPPAFYLLSRRLENREPSPRFPYGFQRAGTLAFFLAAAALTAVGALLFYEGAHTLVTASHPTVSSWRLFDTEVWQGWPMVAALVVSVIPPVILGRKKRKLAPLLHDKVLTVDAETNAADWKTGVAGVVGIVAIAFGLWWGDAAMALLISLSILKDGIGSLQRAGIVLIDGAPRRRESNDIDPDALALADALRARYGDVNVQVRETGRYLRAEVEPRDAPHPPGGLCSAFLGDKGWRLVDVSVAVRDER